ncbi:DUF2802 domain-containing protein [Vibrio salinus]|uniref:DUF2802 domain-containing protein n=1 Tax=Vibrio salinus TaxID=2899784 RepID=UPI001E50CDC5|nr:DUF2802 domain-containing protein [Vibrio salinus]MCE0494581.1 DUF2802 domain-containing protein [Vibrio salinus]
MLDSLINNTPLLIGGGVVILCVFLFLLWLLRFRSHTRVKLEHLRQENRTLGKDLQKANKQILELRSISVGLGQSFSEQQDIVRLLAERISELEQEDRDGRLYSRASKMVKLGADIDELIEECELPKAEAELMLSLQKKLAGQEAIPPLEQAPSSGKGTSKAAPKRSSRRSVR